MYLKRNCKHIKGDIVMQFFDERFRKRQMRFRRNYDIIDDLYKKMEEVSEIYDATIPDIFNVCIEELVSSENIVLYEKSEGERTAPHTILIWESNVEGLEKLNTKYGVSIRKLVNIAIRNVFEKE